MPKITVVLLGIILLVIGIFWLTSSSSTGTALADLLEDKTLELEDVLDDLSVNTRHGNMSPEELLHARRDILAIFDRIDIATNRASGRNVTQRDLERIQDGLGRLARILEIYLLSLAELDNQIALIPTDEYPDDIDESERERTVLMGAISTITDLTEVATVEGSSGDVLEDTIFEEGSGAEPLDQIDGENENDQPSGETAGEAIHLDLAPAN